MDIEEISLIKLFMCADDLEYLELIESLENEYENKRLTKNMSSSQMRAYQDYLYDGEIDDWN